MASTSPDYFALLGLASQFDVDMAALESAYFKAQRQYHPDRFTGRPAPERQQALQQSMDANHAYATLKNPHTRAIYLLKQQGIEVADSQTAQKPSPALLAEVMEWREQAEEAQTLKTLEPLMALLAGLQSEAIGNISQAFGNKDLERMAQETMRLGYILKTSEDIRQKLKRLKIRA